jgi:hypothetical protein
MAKKISYAVRDFASLRSELITLTSQYYPDLINNTNDASIFSVMLDMNAAVADNLHFHIDRVWQETMLDFAQQRQSLYHIAKTYGIKIPGNKPSVALCDFSIIVPPYGDKEDERYLGLLKAGAQISGGGQTFETMDDIDFSDPFNSKGEPNRLKIPNFDANNILQSYTITKREAVVNGVTRIYRRTITDLDQKPFFKIYLPEQNILGVTAVIHKEGTTFASNPTTAEFANTTNKWYEVKTMIQDRVFVADPTSVSDSHNFKAGTYITVDNKFVTEYTPQGYFSLTFGSGNVNPLDNLDNYMNGTMKVNLASFLNNTSLGAIPKSSTTLFVKYRIGGGQDTNLGVNIINSVDNVEFNVNGPRDDYNQQVVNSLSVTNITPAVGGADQPTIEELRNMIAYNFSAQDRAVTLNDYRSLIETMPAEFGAPAKVSVMEEDNKIRIKLLSYDSTGNLTDTVSTTLKNNVLEYLSDYRMINDYIDIIAGEVIDMALDISVTIDKNENPTDIMRSIISGTTSYFDISKRKMGDPLFVGDLQRTVGQISGVINVTELKVYNQIGGQYSSSEVAQNYVDPVTKEIQQIDSTIFMKRNQIYQIRFPNSDIRVRFKTLTTTTY